MCACAGDVTARPGYVLFKFKQAEERKRGGVEKLEECQTLDWISMNSKEADRGDGEREKTWREWGDEEKEKKREYERDGMKEEE